MKNYPDTQLDFLNDPAPDLLVSSSLPPLVLELDQQSWMRFLSEEWLFPNQLGGILLGIGEPCSSEADLERTAVGICFDVSQLPDSNVMAWREGSWISTSLTNLTASDKAVFWNGPLPLFAVGSFRMSSPEVRNHLLAQVRNFSDMEIPQQPIEVFSSNRIDLKAPTRAVFPFGTKKAPEKWDSLRGAAALAIECVPTIGPWLQLLCEMLSKNQQITTATKVDAPWLAHAPWAPRSESLDDHSYLWHAILDVFAGQGAGTDWRADVILRAVCKLARSLGGNLQRIQNLEDSTTKLLKDMGSIRDFGIQDNGLELAFQLVLLRNTPERFISWKKDWPAIPPGAWWTGAILSGYLSGYRKLPLHLRGSYEARKLLALQTWQITDEQSANDWKKVSQPSIRWTIEDDQFQIMKDNQKIASHRISNRGRWYELDLQNPTYEERAKSIALRFCPQLIKEAIILEAGSYALLGANQENTIISKNKLHTSERLELVVNPTQNLAQVLDKSAFYSWLATASLQSAIPSPTLDEESSIHPSFPEKAELTFELNQPPKIRKNNTCNKFHEQTPPSGLVVIQDFITPKEESSLLAAIEKNPWDASMSRRVQHYGWRYDYKSRRVDPSAYIGPLPKWAENLAKKLVKGKFLEELPDQVIVNEYIGNQSISKHIDCIPCFRGAIVTISLLESWEMIFTRKTKLSIEEKYKTILDRRSAAILSGESRNDWFHEIPRRNKEAGKPRERRISITFRKVNNSQ